METAFLWSKTCVSHKRITIYSSKEDISRDISKKCRIFQKWYILLNINTRCVNALFIKLFLNIGQSHKLRVLIEAQYKCKCFDPLSMILISDTYNVLVTSLKPYIVHLLKVVYLKIELFWGHLRDKTRYFAVN